MKMEKQQEHLGIVKEGQTEETSGLESTGMSDEMWQAIVNNDASFDGKFYYAVKTTGIFCRPSCKSRLPIKAHVRIYDDAQQALLGNFRPCKRCRPEGRRLPDEEWVGQLVLLIESRYSESLTLPMLADLIHGSPFHLHRTFKRVMGVTPSDYIQQKRISMAKTYLCESEKSVVEIALAVGIPNAAHFATLFHKKTGFTPTHYRHSFGTEKFKHKGEI
jgi:AraC family transcriptional regulator of adaptative response / methylphosphotriester-DNA alkyltransferase methyltransferase